MKIIASSGRDKYLVEMTDNEIANVAGVSYATSLPSKGYDHHKIELGDEINVHAIFKKLRALEHVEEDLKKSADALRAVATLIDTQIPVVKAQIDDEAKS